MKFIKYKQVARITLYGFDDLLRDNASSVYTEPLQSEFLIKIQMQVFKLEIMQKE